jgi:hypothetical protein
MTTEEVDYEESEEEDYDDGTGDDAANYGGGEGVGGRRGLSSG